MPAILYEKRGPVALITLNRPERHNALDLGAMGLLADTWLDFRDDPQLCVAIVTGAGEADFCCGGDPADFVQMVMHEIDGSDPSGRNSTATQRSDQIDKALVALLHNAEIYKPIIAAVNGTCRASGWQLLLGTDIRVAAPDVRFEIDAARYGLFPEGGTTSRLPRQIGAARALQILLTAEPFDARQACDYGIVNEVVARDQLLPTAQRYAEAICRNGPLAVRAIKEAVVKGLALPLADSLAQEPQYAARVFASEDASEGIEAFQQQRTPRWRGR
ncbi:MAG: enoyl-CoA hydratase-related protein [bacterium]